MSDHTETAQDGQGPAPLAATLLDDVRVGWNAMVVDRQCNYFSRQGRVVRRPAHIGSVGSARFTVRFESPHLGDSMEFPAKSLLFSEPGTVLTAVNVEPEVDFGIINEAADEARVDINAGEKRTTYVEWLKNELEAVRRDRDVARSELDQTKAQLRASSANELALAKGNADFAAQIRAMNDEAACWSATNTQQSDIIAGLRRQVAELEAMSKGVEPEVTPQLLQAKLLKGIDILLALPVDSGFDAEAAVLSLTQALSELRTSYPGVLS